MPVSKEERDRRVAAGLCMQCGINLKEGTTNKCTACKHNDQASRQRTKEKKISSGLCIKEGCHNAAKTGCMMCQACIDQSSVGTSRAYRKKKAAGYCPYCPEGTPCVPGKKACQVHLDKVKVSGKDSYRKCKEAKLCYFCGHPKKAALPGKVCCEEHREQHNARSRCNHKANRTKVFDYYGHKCRCCGLDIDIALQIDHMDGGGTKHLKAIGKGAFYNWLIKNNFPAGYQTLCVLCNWMKSHYGACPHTFMPHEAQQLTWRYTKELSRMLKGAGLRQLNEGQFQGSML